MKADPIFALIEAHRAADKAHAENVALYSALEERLSEQGLTSSQEDKHPDMIAWNKSNDAACAAESRALRKLCRTKPTTLAGISAVTLYLVEAWRLGRTRLGSNPNYYPDPPSGDFLERLLRSLAAAAEAIAARNAPAARGKVVQLRKAA